MIGSPLRVEELKVALLQSRDKSDEGDFRGVGLATEHRFPKKSSTDRDSVETSLQFPVAPGFHGMGIPEFKQLFVARHDFWTDPGRLAIRTTSHDFRKSGIDTDFEGILLEGPRKAVRNMKVLQRDHSSRIRRKPTDFPSIIHRHRKHATTIGCDKHRRPNVPLSGENRLGHSDERTQGKIFVRF